MIPSTSWYLLLVCCLFVARVQAQPDPIEWGDIPDEHLHMTTYAPDTNANAVILADFGNTYFRNGREVVYERHTRIKILREGGYHWGTVSIPYLDDAQYVRRVKGQTFTVQPDGTVKRHRLRKKSIFEEDVDGEWKRVRFTLPALQPGAVIEYRYRHIFENPAYLPGWRFQHTEPTLYSEYRAEIPRTLQYVTVSRGGTHYDVEEETPTNRVGQESTLHRWAKRDVPALRPEPFMTTLLDHQAALSFQLSAYSSRTHGVIRVLRTWDETAQELMDFSGFGGRLRAPRAVRRRAEAVTADIEDPTERMKALYDFVRTSITFNGELGILADRDLDDVLETRTGNSPEIAFLLVALLREAGLEAHPVLISTRDHGQVIEQYPIVDQFNDVLACALIDGKPYLLDATDPYRPYDLLPVSALNGKGWLVDEKKPRWIPVKATGTYRRMVMVNATLHDDGTLSGSVETSNAEYAALSMRHDWEDADSKADFIRTQVLGDLEEVVVTASSIEHLDAADETLKTQATITAPAYAQAAGDMLYLAPILLDRINENPLRLPERTFPVDFAHPTDEVYLLRLTLPEGYAVEDVPPEERIALPLKSGYFIRSVKEEAGMLVVQTRLKIDRAIYPPYAYEGLRTFYDRVVASQSEQVVLRKVEVPDTAPAETGPADSGK